MERLSKIIDNKVRAAEWRPMKIYKKGLMISHLFFVDDLTLFVGADQENCHTIDNILHDFYIHAGQKLNQNKLRVIF